ncbi:MAG: D-serine ammonia-lyase [Desulfohalobium sp.]
MTQQTIAGKTLGQWLASHPLLERITAEEEVFWANPDICPAANALGRLDISCADVSDAAERLERFAPYIQRAFPETAPQGGIIESPLQPIPAMQQELAHHYGLSLPGNLWLKCDSELPISGSIKARGGIYEVLKHAEALALEHGLLAPDADYAALATPEAHAFFSDYRIAVGSTGNLGLSIGIMGAALGFQVTVHMSADARAWKKDLLRDQGVRVVEYEKDYGQAVAEGRRQAAADPRCHFVDDENSRDLFLGYAVAGERLKRQFAQQGIAVDAEHPLFAYLPCGVGGGPGGVAFGLKLAFGDHAHCFFAEPTHAPAMLLGLYTGAYEDVSVQDFGLDNRTAADGLAVGRPSGFVARRMAQLMDGAYTVSDNTMLRDLQALVHTEGIFLEPSALAGMAGPLRVLEAPAYLTQHGLTDVLGEATHLVWGTGGSMVPNQERKEFLRY